MKHTPFADTAPPPSPAILSKTDRTTLIKIIPHHGVIEPILDLVSAYHATRNELEKLAWIRVLVERDDLSLKVLHRLKPMLQTIHKPEVREEREELWHLLKKRIHHIKERLKSD